MKILFVLYNFSSKGTASSIQNRRFIQEINKRDDVEYKIITKEDPFEEFASKTIQISSSWSDFSLKVLGKLFPDISNYPDTQIFWAKKVINYLLKNFNWNYDVIYTVSSPFSAHIIGNRIKKVKKCIWVAHYYDPWNENSFRKFNFEFFKYLDKRLEFHSIKNADIVIHTNQFLVNKWKERFDESILRKVKVHPLFTDPEITIEPRLEIKKSDRPYYFLHSGGVYGNRNFKTILESLKLLSKEIDLDSNLKIIQVGYVSPENMKLVKESSFYTSFIFFPRSSYEFVLKKSSETDFLILLDNPEENNFFFPSKICEYFSLNKPILGLVSEKSISNIFLIQSGHFNILFNDSYSLKQAFLSLVSGKSLSFDVEFYKKFLPKNVVNDILIDIKKYVQK